MTTTITNYNNIDSNKENQRTKLSNNLTISDNDNNEKFLIKQAGRR